MGADFSVTKCFQQVSMKGYLNHTLQGEVYVEREVEELPHQHASRDESASSRKSRTFDYCIQEDDRKTKKWKMSR